MRIYVASSWRNEQQQEVVKALRNAGHEVYDFKNPKEGDKGFHWSEIDPNWQNWTPIEYRDCLDHPVAERGFKSDYEAMQWANVFVGVQPFGRSASLEMGWAAGKHKMTILLLENGEPELMVKILHHICCDISEVIELLTICDYVCPECKYTMSQELWLGIPVNVPCPGCDKKGISDFTKALTPMGVN